MWRRPAGLSPVRLIRIWWTFVLLGALAASASLVASPAAADDPGSGTGSGSGSVINGSEVTPVITGGTTAAAESPRAPSATAVSPINLCRPKRCRHRCSSVWMTPWTPR